MEPTTEASGRTRRTKTAFRLEYAVAIEIRATPQRLWSLLTDARDFPRWNSTVESIEGDIVQGQRLQLRVKSAPGRVFKPAVRELVAGQRMVWADGMPPMFTGVRTFELVPRAGGATEFRMTEVFRGLMLPMIAGSLPDFAPVFEQYAADLKREAERA
jgi:uncharacterized protein YndB with AHSA1/START domain